MAWLPIQDYGIVGDLHTVALVGTNGSIDWWCAPRFDSPSIFAALLDDEIGGRFQIAPSEPCNRRQLYLPDTNVLITRFLANDGVAELTDFMPVRSEHAKEIEPTLLRRVDVVRGTMALRAVCSPAFDYARQKHTVALVEGGAVFTSASGQRLTLSTGAKLAQEGDAVVADLQLKEGDTVWFELDATDVGAPAPRSAERLDAAFQSTVRFWRRWLSSGSYDGRWREMVNRSALCLKLLTHQPTGAIVAAPTTSLPEHVGGSRNWDYRFTWIRDASFTLYGLLRVGFTDEARAFMGWLTARLAAMKGDGGLGIMYTIDGGVDVKEVTLDHLSGYRGSKPVRIGNAAFEQLQLDITGELMDAVYLYNKHVEPIGTEMWRALRGIVDWVCENWNRPDDGVWETRGGRQQFVYSKVMCWVA
ncbi:MAG TPA: glycoside hydrolase family 15 protein, partial [Myxococcota bacterium]